jgi:hypothetical protein
MTEEQIKHLVDRFLGWRLPRNFNPDAGIRYSQPIPMSDNEPPREMPSGTNLFDATQANEMVRHMIAGMPEGASPETFAWLIEAPGQNYLRAVRIGRDEFRWTKDRDEAIRFFNENQADQTMMVLRKLAPALFGFEATLGDAKATEHGWVS